MTRTNGRAVGRLRAMLPVLAALASLAVCVVVLQREQTSGEWNRLPALANALHSELDRRVDRVFGWADRERNALERTAADPRLVGGVERALKGEHVELDALLDRTCLAFEGCGIYTPEGVQVGAFRLREVPRGLVSAGAVRSRHSRVLRTDAVGRLNPAGWDARFSVFFATPLTLASGRRLVLVGRAGADESLDPLVSSQPIGRTGESYVFEEHGYMVTRSRFFHRAPKDPAPRVLGRPAIELVTPGEAPTLAVSAVRRGRTLGIDIDGYVDYRGVVVVGAWRWIDELGAGVVTEIDRAEAMHGPVSVLR